MTKKLNRSKIYIATLIVVASLLALVVPISRVNAASTITVNSTADTTANDGECTLREAIIASNTDTVSGAAAGECVAGSGNDTIEFDITGTADFTNAGQDGYTIAPTSALPDITETVTIDGYSQPDSQANTAVAPAPLNGILLIELDGSGAGLTADGLSLNADNSEVRGLVINRFVGTGIGVAADNLVSQGNYIGTDPTGLIARANDSGINNRVSGSEDLLVGGLDPEDRNLISGNTSNGSSPNTGDHGWVYQGNYIGVDASGMAALPNSQPGGSGALSLDDSDNHVVGGSEIGAINVISGNASIAIAPQQSLNTRVEGNYIGVAADGSTPLGNGGAGVNYSTNSTGGIITDNILSNNSSDGISALSSSTATITGNTITSNGGMGIKIESTSTATITGNTVTSNAGLGISAYSDSTATITGNIVTNNTFGGIRIDNDSTATITGNTISSNSAEGINIYNSSDTIIGGITETDRNIISDNVGANIELFAFGGTTDNTIIQGNDILNSQPDGTGESSGVRVFILATNTLIGGITDGAGNRFESNAGSAVAVEELEATAFSLVGTPSNVAILGNTITGTATTSGIKTNSGLGIDLFRNVDTSPVPDTVAESYLNDGPTLNDVGDVDTGPNDFLNFPVITSTSATPGSLSATFNLDVDETAPNGYRVEFFANDTADPSGHGEGQYYLGSYDVAGDVTGQSVALSVPAGLATGSYAISATTTEKDDSTDGFGATSEFSANLANQSIVAASTGSTDTSTDTDTALADTGVDVFAYFAVAVVLIAGSSKLIKKYR